MRTTDLHQRWTWKMINAEISVATLMATKKLSGIMLRAFQSRHCFGEDLFRR
jgi:hypothetical protein